MKLSPEEILKSIDSNFDYPQPSKMNIVLEYYDSINSCISELKERILKITLKYSTKIKFLTFPSIKELLVIFIIT